MKHSEPIDLLGLLEGPPAVVNVHNVVVEGEIPSLTARLLVDCRCQLGECVLWDDRRDAVVFVNILERSFHRLIVTIETAAQAGTNATTKLETYTVPKMIGAFALLDNHPGYLVAWEDGFQLYDLEGGHELGPMSRGEVVNRSGLPDRLNDGRVDPTGTRFVCGGCAGFDAPLKVYTCEYDATTNELVHTPLVDEIRVTNSICWSRDGKTMYLSDSPTQQIHQFDYDENGKLSNKRLLHTKPTGNPDGSVVDAQGFLWNATWRQGAGTAMVDRIDPYTGEVVFSVLLPDNTSEASCCCFGGPNLDILFITTAFEYLDPATEPHAGGLYAVKLPPGMSGRKESRFNVPK